MALIGIVIFAVLYSDGKAGTCSCSVGLVIFAKKVAATSGFDFVP